MRIVPVRSATADEEHKVLATVTVAFARDDFARWLLADPWTYLTVSPQFAQAFGGPAFDHRTVDMTEDGRAAALWLPPGVEPDGERLAALVHANAPAAIVDDAEAVFAAMAEAHPAEPFWFLPLIAVDPAVQGRGFGSALLRHALERCDASGRPAYLEATTSRNVRLYERHGFERLGTIQVGSSPEVVPMLRRPG